NESLSCMLGRLLSVEYGNTGDTGEEVCWSGLDRPVLNQEPGGFGGTEYYAELADFLGLQRDSHGPSLLVHERNIAQRDDGMGNECNRCPYQTHTRYSTVWGESGFSSGFGTGSSSGGLGGSGSLTGGAGSIGGGC